ncbi:MAG: hypothetical protein K6T65_09930 [Peptococcaceae bacterium]|nr:hypothetical protein [Peptococcaceae bacterium]
MKAEYARGPNKEYAVVEILRKIICSLTLIMACLILPACSARPAAPAEAGAPGRFARAEELGQFVPVNRSVDCRGTVVTIEKVLLDRTGTFMIAAVDGSIRGEMDYLCVDLFDGRGRDLGRSTFLQKLPGGKTLLTFGPVDGAPGELRLEFFGGPVGYGDKCVVLDLKGINLKPVEKKFVLDYRLAETLDKDGYRLAVDSITAGISETMIRYRLIARRDYDGIDHGWLYDWYNNYSPEGEILSLSDGGRRLEAHLTGINCLGPYYRVSRDKRTMLGSARFGPLNTYSLRLSLADMYGYYGMNETIPIKNVGDRLDINRKVPVRGYTVELKSFARDSGDDWVLDYAVLDAAGNTVDAAIDGCIYGNEKHRVPLACFNRFRDALAGDRRLVMRWQPPGGGDYPEWDPVIKILRLGIRLEDAVLDINLANFKRPPEFREEDLILAAVKKFYDTLGSSLSRGDISACEEKYGYLRPTGRGWDGINDWRRDFEVWGPLEVKEFAFSIGEPIITIDGNTAKADLVGYEKILHRHGDSAGGFSTVVYLEKVEGQWKITMVDDLTEEEMYGVH